MGFNDVITIVYQETAESSKQNLKDSSYSELLNYFAWKEFHIRQEN